jgi:peptide/nickel transport system substrate-binding protein
LAFITGKVDMTWPYSVRVPLLKDIRNQAPQVICELAPNNVSSKLIVNRDAAPFQNPDLRRAMALSLDRKAFIDILSDAEGDIGGVMQPRITLRATAIMTTANPTRRRPGITVPILQAITLM